MTLDQASSLIRDFLDDKFSGYEFDDFLNSKQTGEVERIKLRIIDEAMPFSFDRSSDGIKRFKNKIAEIIEHY